jgi:hypothetical protein
MYLANFYEEYPGYVDYFEIMFLFDLILNFFVDYNSNDGLNKRVKDISKISKRYLYGNFLFDLFPLLPL